MLASGIGGYIGWLLWGTGLATQRSQDQLRSGFVQQIGSQSPPAPGEDRAQLPGSAYAELVIPRMSLDIMVVEGTSTLDLEKGPGHYSRTADPWDSHGRVGIAGHRTTYLAPFWSLDKLGPGDDVILRTKYGTYHYAVTGSRTISPLDASVLDQTTQPTLVLTTCTPRFSASQRLVVFADRV
ncbi:MAG: sortase [Actinomycetota bacterium]|nr:sortase [Actinomycetota bacterium]